MDQRIATAAAIVLAAKIFADLLRQGYGFERRNIITSAQHNIEIDIAYLLTLAACVVVVAAVGPAAALPLAILMRVGHIVNKHILLTGNHPLLELLVVVILYRLLDRPAALASALQLTIASVWIYSALQKLYHGEFMSGAFFFLSFQGAKDGWRYAWLKSTLPRIDGFFAPVDPAGQAMCRRLAIATVATELLIPVLALATSGTPWSAIVLLVVTLPVGLVSRETNFMLTNLVLAAFFLIPFDGAALRSIANDPIAAGVVLWCLTWPAVHAVLTKRLRVSSWKLAGWGMYATRYPWILIVDTHGALKPAVARSPNAFDILRVCGACEIGWLRRYASRKFFRASTTEAAALVFGWYRKRGDRYVSTCMVLANAPEARPIAWEIGDEQAARAFMQHLGELASARAPSTAAPATALSAQPA